MSRFKNEKRRNVINKFIPFSLHLSHFTHDLVPLLTENGLASLHLHIVNV